MIELTTTFNAQLAFLASGTEERMKVRGRNGERACHAILTLTLPSPSGRGIAPAPVNDRS